MRFGEAECKSKLTFEQKPTGAFVKEKLEHREIPLLFELFEFSAGRVSVVRKKTDKK